jgi:hypothetical protein
MKMLEIVGNLTDTMCRVLGERATLGAAKKFADECMRLDMERDEPKFYSVDVDDKGRVLYVATPDTVSITLRNERRQLQPAE